VTLLHIDAPTGLAGNMLLAALLDLGVPETVIHGPLADLGLAGRYRLEVEERRSSGLRGLHLEVHCLEQDPHHRPWGELRDLLMSAPLAPPLAEQVRQVFLLLAEAEARVHGQAPEARAAPFLYLQAIAPSQAEIRQGSVDDGFRNAEI